MKTHTVTLAGMVGGPDFHPGMLENLPEVDRLVVRVASDGGYGDPATACAARLEEFAGEVVADIAFAASAAIEVVMSCDRRLLRPDGWIALHAPWGVGWGTVAEIRAAADRFELDHRRLAAIYAQASGLPLAEIEQLMESARPLYAGEALDLGLVHAVAGGLAGAPRPPNLPEGEHNRRRLLAWADSDEVNFVQRCVLRWLARIV